MRGIIQKRCNPGDESEINPIDIEFFVVKKGIHSRIKHILHLFCTSRILDDGVSQSSSSSSFVLGRFPAERTKLPPLAFPSSFSPMSILAIGPNP
jgi:hypothetical protein